jgi:hypothetical protein
MRPRAAAVVCNERNEGRLRTMWVIALEALVALGLLLLIVWLTMSPSRRRDDTRTPRTHQDGDSDEKP